jgi:formyl-CoA transferase
MKSDKGRKLVHELATSADVAIESFGTGVAERLGIDAASLCALNDRLIHCSISGFGRTGPLKGSPGYDVILQAFSGIMSMTGDEGGGYIRSPISPIDQLTGVHAFSGILASLLAREKSGKGAAIQVSLLDTALGLLGYNLQTFWQRGTQPTKCGSSHESLCPYQAFEASDGPIMIGVANDNLWRKFCGVTALNAIVDDPKFRTNADRVKHRAETLHLAEAAIATNTVAHWNAVLNEVGIPCSPINTLPQLLDHPHTKANKLIMQYDHPTAGRLNCVGHPVTFLPEERDPGLPPPLLGQHTDDVLKDMGLSAASIAELRREKIVG